ncbi:MAG: phytanoyl-CoA dioxygenase family protein [Candidatus Latescibacterota bacterium]|jgi:ectoine hydroxylase-related dioxygenase (phytanoyl-CoA dioxygenase family)
MHDIDAILREVDERGYCKVPNIISAEKAEQASAAVQRLLDAEKADATQQAQSQRVGRIAVKAPIFLELMCHPFVIEVWKKYLGDDIMCSSFSSNTMYPGHEQIGWHSDYPYWSLQPPWPAGNFAGQTLWMLDDFTEENGATGGIPFSHRKGHPPDEPTNTWRDDGEILEGAKGSVVFAHGAWWHTARPNQTQQPRSCLLSMYLMPWFIPQEDMRGQLAELENPSELARQLLCGKQHSPRDVGAPT